jgi:hypothetical protein
MPKVDVPGLRPPGDDLKKIPQGECLIPDNVRRIPGPVGIIQDVFKFCQGAALDRDRCQDVTRKIPPVELVGRQ